MLFAIPRRKIDIIKGEISQVIKTFILCKAIKGMDIKLFEAKFANYLGAKYAFTISSGRSALYTILKILEFPFKSEVVIPAYTDESVLEAIINAGLKPIFVDIKGDDFNINVKELENKITKNTKIIVATHIFGSICDIEKILEICNKYEIILIEDCAHSIGASFKGRKAGSFGRLSYFSFSATKPFHTYGGGCIVTNDDILAEKIKIFLSNAETVSVRYLLKEILITWLMALGTNYLVFTFTGYPILVFTSIWMNNDLLISTYNKIFKNRTSRKIFIKKFSNLQARIGLMRLALLEKEISKRKGNVAILRKYIRGDILNNEMKSHNGSVYYFYILCLKDRKNLFKKLLWKRIDTGKYLMRNVAALYNDGMSYPITEWIYEHSLQIPIYKYLSKKAIKYIAEILNKEYS